MTDHVFRTFPDHIEAIHDLMQKNQVFRDICFDYEEISTWLACCEGKEDFPPDEYNRAQEVKKDLEKDIQAKLGEEGFRLET